MYAYHVVVWCTSWRIVISNCHQTHGDDHMVVSWPVSDRQAKEIEVIQNMAGRQVLGARCRTHTDMIRGELGWLPLEARRISSQLMLFHHLQRMSDDRLTRHVFIERMATAPVTTLTRSPGYQPAFPNNNTCPSMCGAIVNQTIQNMEVEQWKRRMMAEHDDDAAVVSWAEAGEGMERS